MGCINTNGIFLGFWQEAFLKLASQNVSRKWTESLPLCARYRNRSLSCYTFGISVDRFCNKELVRLDMVARCRMIVFWSNCSGSWYTRMRYKPLGSVYWISFLIYFFKKKLWTFKQYKKWRSRHCQKNFFCSYSYCWIIRFVNIQFFSSAFSFKPKKSYLMKATFFMLYFLFFYIFFKS